MKMNAVALLVASILCMIPGSTLAHHSISAEFDGSRRVVLSGTITKVEWTNPHTFFFVDAKDPRTGQIVSWAYELSQSIKRSGGRPDLCRVLSAQNRTFS